MPERGLINRRQLLKLGALSAFYFGARFIDMGKMGRPMLLLQERGGAYGDKLFRLYERYGIEIYTGLPLWMSAVSVAETPSQNEINYSLDVLAETLGKYPPSIFRENNTTQFALIRDLKLYGQELNGLNIPVLGLVCLDTENIDPAFIDHEIYHSLNDGGGNVTQALSRLFYGNSDWVNTRSESPDSYARAYGMTSTSEDRATIAEFLLHPSLHSSLLERSNTPGGIALVEKIAIVRGQYSRWSGGRMDEQYWTDLRNGLVSEDYWKDR